MTFQQRYDELKEFTENFTKPGIGRHHFLRNLKEVKKESRAEALAAAAKVLEGDVLLTADEFEGQAKLAVFKLLERLSAQIRALADA